MDHGNMFLCLLMIKTLIQLLRDEGGKGSGYNDIIEQVNGMIIVGVIINVRRMG